MPEITAPQPLNVDVMMLTDYARSRGFTVRTFPGGIAGDEVGRVDVTVTVVSGHALYMQDRDTPGFIVGQVHSDPGLFVVDLDTARHWLQAQV